MVAEAIRSDELGARHGFFTRRGGVSTGLYAGLNCGLSSGDQPDDVRRNRELAAEALDVSGARMATVRQVHGAKVCVVADLTEHDPSTEADAMVTATPDVALGILTADCQPVLFSDPAAGVVGAAHAGWRGALEGVLEATLDAMEGLGAKRENTTAVIGPTISQASYEVGPEFADPFLNDNPDTSRFFINGQGDRYLFDLPGYGLYRLREAGIGSASWTGDCTYRDADRFYSYRRSFHQGEPGYGRLISAIAV